jgi:hypothetical protein
MRDVPLSAGAKIRAGAKVVDYARSMSPTNRHGGAKISFQFDMLVFQERQIPIATNLRASCGGSQD